MLSEICFNLDQSKILSSGKGLKDTDCIENIVEIGEIAHFDQFHLFPQCFPEVFLFSVLKSVYMFN